MTYMDSIKELSDIELLAETDFQVTVSGMNNAQKILKTRRFHVSNLFAECQKRFHNGVNDYIIKEAAKRSKEIYNEFF